MRHYSEADVDGLLDRISELSRRSDRDFKWMVFFLSVALAETLALFLILTHT